MNIVPWKPFDELTTLRLEMDSILNRFFPEIFFEKPYFSHEWLPTVDLKETKGMLVVKAELPGLDVEDVELTLVDDILSIRGEKQEEKETKDEHTCFVERYTGTFERKIRLPALVQTDKVDATFAKGILTINMPKSEEDKKKEIKIKVH